MLIRRTVHQCLILDRIIQAATHNTMFLFGHASAQNWVMERCNIRAYDGGGDTPIFWCPYPGISLSGYIFHHIVVDPSFDSNNLDHADWFRKSVMDHLAPGYLVTTLA